MRRDRVSCLFGLAVVLLTTAGAAAQEAAEGGAPSPLPAREFFRDEFSVLLIVSGDPGVVPAGETIATALAHNARLKPLGYVARLASWQGTTSCQATGVLVFRPIDKRSGANREEVVKVAADHLQGLLDEMAKAREHAAVGQLDQCEHRVAEAEVVMRKSQDQCDEVKRQLHVHGVFSDSLESKYGPLARESLELGVELAGLDARRDAILKNIARIKEAKEKAAPQGPDPELVRLDAAIEAREKQMDRLLEANKRTPASVAQADIDIARTELVLAKAEADAKRRAMAEQTPALLSELNRQLVDLEIRRAEAETRLRTIEGMLQQVKEGPLLGLLAQQSQLARQLEQANARLSEAVKARDDLKRDLDLLQGPRVRIIPLEGKPEPRSETGGNHG